MTDTKATTTTDAPTQGDDRTHEAPPADRLTTADIAADRPTRPDPAQEESSTQRSEPSQSIREGQQHSSEVPGPTLPSLFADEQANDLHGRWDDIQAGFVDEPRRAVEHADALVAEVMKQLAESFATERQTLEGQWAGGGDPSTEDLRVALRRYRSFFDRLLSV